MTAFEKLIQKTFDDYANAAYLMILHPQMKCVGTRDGKVPLWVQVAKAPFDLAGFYLDNGRYIAVELKENAKRHSSLQIIGPGKKGTGLQYHQLEGLVTVHNAGGLAYVLWENAGEVGVVDGARLKAAKTGYDTALRAAAAGYPNGARGVKSIQWGNFKPVKLDQRGHPLWLPENDGTATTVDVDLIEAPEEDEPDGGNNETDDGSLVDDDPDRDY